MQNHPETYGEIVELCRAHGISTHFSNIIGFPPDTEAGVLEHLEMLRELRPDVASFYILSPIPGTEQYDEFLSEGLITERNLDRFDGTCVTWRHPHFERAAVAGAALALLPRVLLQAATWPRSSCAGCSRAGTSELSPGCSPPADTRSCSGRRSHWASIR